MIVESDTLGVPTVRFAEPQIAPSQAVTVVEPEANVNAVPRLVTSLVMEASIGSEVLQVAEWSIPVVVSAKVPIAVNC